MGLSKIEKKECLVSIIIPVYNVEDYLRECVNSVLQQTYRNIQIVIINDGSTDNSGKICEEIASAYSNILYIFQKNGGLSAARNTGIENSQGKYVFFLDSDDYIHKDTIYDLVQAMEINSADIGTIGLTAERESFEKIHKSAFVSGSNRLFYLQKITNHACGKLYNIKLFQDVRFPVGQNYEDIATTHILFSKSNVITYSESNYYFYRLRSGAITLDISEKNISDFWKSYGFVKVYYGENRKNYIDYYLLTIIYNIFSRVYRNKKLYRKYKKLLRNEFLNISSCVDIYKYKNSPMRIRLLLYKYNMGGLCITAVDFIRSFLKGRKIVNE